MRAALWVAILATMFPTFARAAGLARGDNFSVIVPATPNQEAGDQYAKLVLHRAESFRLQFVNEWLGGVAPARDVRTMIRIRFSETENSGMTLARDDPSQKFHNVFLATSAENASGPMLRHELVHVVLATAYFHRLPPWVEEGIASRYDDQRLIVIRQQEVRSWVRTGQYPPLAGLLQADRINSNNDTGYAAAEALVAYLLTLGDKHTLIRFADEGQRIGWDAALRAHYGITDQGQLQRGWQAYLGGAAQ